MAFFSASLKRRREEKGGKGKRREERGVRREEKRKGDGGRKMGNLNKRVNCWTRASEFVWVSLSSSCAFKSFNFNSLKKRRKKNKREGKK